jgi:hypothetical protein
MATGNIILDTWDNPALIAKSFDLRNPTFTPLLNWIFPEGKRQDWPWVKVTRKDIDRTLKNVPHSNRGTVGYAIQDEGFNYTDFEPKPIVQKTFAKASELKDLETIEGEDAKAMFISRFTTKLRDQTLLTIEAMLATFLSGTGTITITKHSSQGMVTETFVMGTLPSVTTSVKWDAAGAEVTDVIKTFDDMDNQLLTKNYGRNGATYACGSDAYYAMLSLLENYVSTVGNRPDGPDPNGIVIENGRMRVNLYGRIIIPISGTYTAYSAAGAETSTNLMDPDIVYALANDNDNVLYYCALDRMDGKDKGRLVIDVDEQKRGLGIESESKPFPVIDVYSMCYSDVMT